MPVKHDGDDPLEKRWPQIPPAIRPSFDDLWNDVASLHAKWTTYRELFGSEDSVIALNETAPATFQLIEETLRSDMVMSFGRLCDPPTTGKKANLSLAWLVDEIGDTGNTEFKSQLQSELAAVKLQCEAILEWRNRRVGHNDLTTALRVHQSPLPRIGPSYVNKSLELIAALLNRIELHYSTSETRYDVPVLRGGATDLVFWLKLALKHARSA